ncbi:hypothetical protein QFZ49_007093 [Streptomyces turgidiscabies]|uniref:Transposase n=1 Tax=Streptomyces turgidiscabies TaxID=85558 RepID=A0ABU0RYQ5_9ACTN|nr:hypothetical protein [Streptomyces turgidiscabies]
MPPCCFGCRDHTHITGPDTQSDRRINVGADLLQLVLDEEIHEVPVLLRQCLEDIGGWSGRQSPE